MQIVFLMRRSGALEATLGSAMDFSSLEEMDPSLAEGHRIFYEREVPFELRSADGVEEPQEVGTISNPKVPSHRPAVRVPPRNLCGAGPLVILGWGGVG
jgi:hypothetical protein